MANVSGELKKFMREVSKREAGMVSKYEQVTARLRERAEDSVVIDGLVAHLSDEPEPTKTPEETLFGEAAALLQKYHDALTMMIDTFESESEKVGDSPMYECAGLMARLARKALENRHDE